MPSGDDGYYQYVPSNEKSPVTYNYNDITANTMTLVLASMKNSTKDTRYRAVLSYNKKTGKIYGHTYDNNSSESARASFVITKIEVYN